MIANLLNMFFGCWHRNYSFPITVRRGRRAGASALTGTYVVCLECGKEFAYDWKAMKVVSGNAEPSSGLAEPAESYANGRFLKAS